jgi:hypothetical protein
MRSQCARESIRHAIVCDEDEHAYISKPETFSYAQLSKYTGGERDVWGVEPLLDVWLFCAQTSFGLNVRSEAFSSAPRILQLRSP